MYVGERAVCFCMLQQSYVRIPDSLCHTDRPYCSVNQRLLKRQDELSLEQLALQLAEQKAMLAASS
jgi:hypothetical protein